MRRSPLLLLALLWLGGPARADEAPRPAAPAPSAEAQPSAPAEGEPTLTLRDAVALGKVVARGERPSGYSKLHLTLTNPGKEALAVDVCGARLAPETPRSCQRLGVGPAEERSATRKPRPGSVVVDLAPGETKSLPFRTCCLDLRLSAPSSQRFRVLREPAPPAVETVLRWWADHPDVPQGTVNSAIWAGRETVAWDPKEGPAALAWSRGRHEPAVASCAGTAYQLFEGRLSALDANGERRVLGSDIVRVIPTPDALYAVFPLSSWRAELRRLALTGEDDDTWSLVATLTDSDVPTHVLPHSPGGLLLVGPDRILRLPKGAREPEPLLTSHGPCSARLEPDGSATLVTSRARQGRGWIGITHTLAPEAQTTVRTGEHWNLREVRAGAAGVFGLLHVGELARLAHGKWKKVGSVRDVDTILFVGRHVLWLRGKDGRPYAVDPDTGREVSRPDARVEDAALSLDTVSGEVVSHYRGAWSRWKARDGVVEELPAP